MLSMVEIDQKKLETLERDAIMYLRRNEDKFHEAAKALTQQKSILQNVADWIHCKNEMYGISIHK